MNIIPSPRPRNLGRVDGGFLVECANAPYGPYSREFGRLTVIVSIKWDIRSPGGTNKKDDSGCPISLDITLRVHSAQLLFFYPFIPQWAQPRRPLSDH